MSLPRTEEASIMWISRGHRGAAGTAHYRSHLRHGQEDLRLRRLEPSVQLKPQTQGKSGIDRPRPIGMSAYKSGVNTRGSFLHLMLK